jgi:hypothetical protein
MRSVLLAIIALAAGLALARDVEHAPNVIATSPPSAQRFSVDMDPTAVPGNTAMSVGTRETCARINENGIMDADEDMVDTVEFDVTVTGIPAANAMIAYSYDLGYPTATRIVSHQPVKIGAGPIIQGEIVPPPDTDGTFNVSVADFSGPAESGSGTLDRLRIDTTALAVSGIFPISLSNAAHLDTNGNSWAPDALDDALLAVNQACPPPADLKMVSQTVTFPSATAVGIDTTLSLARTVHNNGPAPVDLRTVASFTISAGCAVDGQTGTATTTDNLTGVGLSVAASAPRDASVNCVNLGSHQISVTSCVDSIGSVDSNQANNCDTDLISFDTGAPPGTDTDGDGVWDLEEFNCGVSTLSSSLRPERVDGAFDGVDDDGDTMVDEGLPGGFDCDGDGYGGSAENHVYSYLPQTDGDQKTCQEYDLSFPNANPDVRPSKRWPSDISKSTGPPNSFNRVNILDLAGMVAPVRYLSTNVGSHPSDVRFDLAPGGLGTSINIADLAAMIAGSSGMPAMLGGVRTFGGPPCPWAP